MEKFKFDENKSALNNLSANWIDKELVDIILESLSNMSKRQLNRFIGDSNDWISKISSKKNKKVSELYPVKYPNFRRAADFLAIPPWFLFYRTNKGEGFEELNDEIIKMFQRVPPNLPIFEIKKNKNKQTIDFISIEENINIDKFILKNIGSDELSNHTYLKGKWKDIQNYLSENLERKSFSAAALIYAEGPYQYLSLGTLRIKSQKHIAQLASEMKKYGAESFWTTAWFSIEIYSDELEYHQRYIKDIILNITHFLGVRPWHFLIENGEKVIQLYSWHSLRDINAFDSEIKASSIIEGKLKKVKNPLEISIANGKKIFEGTEKESSFIDEFQKYIRNCLDIDTPLC